MADIYQELVIATLRRCLELGLKPDGFLAVDDLGYTTGLLMSPDSWCRIYRPAVGRLGEFLTGRQIDFWLHSCGDIRPLIPDLLDCGVQVLNPVQVRAGLQVEELRRKYRGRLAFYGGIDVAKMSGPEDALDEHIRSTVSSWRDGGYIFHSDHSVPPQVSLDRYRWLLARARYHANRGKQGY